MIQLVIGVTPIALAKKATEIEAHLSSKKDVIQSYFKEHSLTGKPSLSREEAYYLLEAIGEGSDSFHVQSYNSVFRHWGLLTELTKDKEPVVNTGSASYEEKMFDIFMRICDEETIAKAKAEHALEDQKAKLLDTGLTPVQIKAIAATL